MQDILKDIAYLDLLYQLQILTLRASSYFFIGDASWGLIQEISKMEYTKLFDILFKWTRIYSGTSIFRYHKKCYAEFVSERNIIAAKNSMDQTSDDKEPFNHVLKILRKSEDKIWSSTELLHLYKEKGGNESNTTRLVNRIFDFMTDELYTFKSPGLATIIMHKKKASQILKVCPFSFFVFVFLFLSEY